MPCATDWKETYVHLCADYCTQLSSERSMQLILHAESHSPELRLLRLCWQAVNKRPSAQYVTPFEFTHWMYIGVHVIHTIHVDYMSVVCHLSTLACFTVSVH